MAKYLDWNKELVDYFFKEEYSGNNIFLCITDTDLDRIGKEKFGIENGNLDYLETILDESVALNVSQNIVDKAVNVYLSNKQYGKNKDSFTRTHKDNSNLLKLIEMQDEYPPYVGYLTFFCLAEMESLPEASSHLYYKKVFSLIKKLKTENIYNYFPKNSSEKMSILFHLWRDLEVWSNDNNKGRFSYYRGDYQKHAGKARINAILSYSERSMLYSKLVSRYDKNVLPNKIDIIPYVQKISAKYGAIFTRKAIINDHHKEVKSNNKFIRDAIYNIVVSDIKNEFIEVSNNKNFVKVENLIGVLKVNNFPNPSIISHIYIDQKNQNHKFLNIKENKHVVNNWLRGGAMPIKNRRYDILSGPLKIFAKNQKSVQIAGASAYAQVNRIIENGGTYIIGAYKENKEAFLQFENWVEKHSDLNLSHIDIKDIGPWEFYKIKNPKYNLPLYNILIQKNNQKEFHNDKPNISLKEGLKISNGRYLRSYEPKIIVENFNYYKNTEQYDISVSAINIQRDEKEIAIDDYELISFEDFIQIKINYNTFNYNFKLKIMLDVIGEENDIFTFEKEFDIIYPEINKDIWNNNFSNYGFAFPKIDNFENVNTESGTALNIFDNFSLDLHQDNFNNIISLLIDEEYLTNKSHVFSKDQLVNILKNIFILKIEYEEGKEEDVSILIRLIHFVQLFEFIFIKLLKADDDLTEVELLGEIAKCIDKNLSDNIIISHSVLDLFIYELNIAHYAPFLIWSNLKKIIKKEDSNVKIEDLLRDFLLVSFDDYNVGRLTDKKELWRYNEFILFIYMTYRKKKGETVDAIIDNLEQAWVYNGIQSLDSKTNRVLKRYYIGIMNTIRKKEDYYSNYYNIFLEFIDSNNNGSYGFEILMSKNFQTKNLDEQDSEVIQKNDIILESLSYLCSYKTNHNIKYLEFRDLLISYNETDINPLPRVYLKNFISLGHVHRDNKKIFVCPPFLNFMGYNQETGLAKYLLSGARDKILMDQIESYSRDFNINIRYKTQPSSYNPSAEIFEGMETEIIQFLKTINSDYGDNYISLNKNNHIFRSILLKYIENNNMVLTEEVSPEASYLSKKYFDPIRFLFGKKDSIHNYDIIEYVYDRFGSKTYKYYTKNKKNGKLYSELSKQEAILKFFALNKISFIHYHKIRKQLIIPIRFRFPANIEKALIIKSGVLPKLIQHDNLSDTVQNKSILFKFKLKYFDNITVNDLKLLENAINQKTIEVTRLNYIDEKS